MLKMKLHIYILLLLCVANSTVFAELVIKGSETLGAKMVPQLIEVYRVSNPRVEFKVEAEGSTSCFKGLLKGECHIGMASRPAKDEELKLFSEKGMKLHEHVTAYDMIALITNKQVKVNNLTTKQVEQIFTGDIRTWNPVGGSGAISVFKRNSSSRTYKTFQKLAMNGKAYGNKSKIPAGGMQIVSSVAEDKQAISYVGLAYNKVKGIKIINVDGVEPTPKNIETYPLSRKLYFYTTGETSDDVQSFIDWVVTSKDAAKVIEKVGFISIQSTKQKNQ